MQKVRFGCRVAGLQLLLGSHEDVVDVFGIGNIHESERPISLQRIEKGIVHCPGSKEKPEYARWRNVRIVELQGSNAIGGDRGLNLAQVKQIEGADGSPSPFHLLDQDSFAGHGVECPRFFPVHVQKASPNKILARNHERSSPRGAQPPGVARSSQAEYPQLPEYGEAAPQQTAGDGEKVFFVEDDPALRLACP